MSAEVPAFSEELIRHRYADLDDVRLHYVEAGEGPLVILLHGFPELWYAWRHQIACLREAGFRVVAPDLRGFGRSDKPRPVAAYRVEALAGDVEQLVRALGETSAAIVGHDWGGMAAWWTAMLHPERVRRLSVANCPHPGHIPRMMGDPRQLRRSWYILLAQVPGVIERGLVARDGLALRRLFSRDPERKDAFSPEDIEHYVEAFRDGAARSAVKLYRALLRRRPRELRARLRPIEVPTQVIWGARDRHIVLDYAQPPAKWVWDLRFDAIDDASHWVQVDRPQAFNARLLDFLARP